MQAAEALALEVPPLPVAAIYRRIGQIVLTPTSLTRSHTIPGGGEGICGDLLRCAHASARDWQRNRPFGSRGRRVEKNIKSRYLFIADDDYVQSCIGRHPSARTG